MKKENNCGIIKEPRVGCKDIMLTSMGAMFAIIRTTMANSTVEAKLTRRLQLTSEYLNERRCNDECF